MVTSTFVEEESPNSTGQSAS